MPPSKRSAEDLLELLLDGVEGLAEELLGLAVELGDGRLEVVDGLVDVVLLGGQQVVALLELVVFLQRIHIDRPHLVDLLAQFVERSFDSSTIDLELAQFLDHGLELGVVRGPDDCPSDARSSCGARCA